MLISIKEQHKKIQVYS